MKFAKELREELTPEWRVKYLDYRTGKQKVKAVRRALAKLNASPTPTAARNERTPGTLLRRGSASWFVNLTPRQPASRSPVGKMSDPLWNAAHLDPATANHADLDSRLQLQDPRLLEPERTAPTLLEDADEDHDERSGHPSRRRRSAEGTENEGSEREADQGHDGRGEDDGEEEASDEEDAEEEEEEGGGEGGEEEGGGGGEGGEEEEEAASEASDPDSYEELNKTPIEGPVELPAEVPHQTEQQPLRSANGNTRDAQFREPNYGSILSSTASRPGPGAASSLALPDPALPPSSDAFPSRYDMSRQSPVIVRRASSVTGDAYEIGKTRHPPHLPTALLPKHRDNMKPTRTMSTPDAGVHPSRKAFVRRIFRSQRHDPATPIDVPLESYKEFDQRQSEFFVFLDKELEKIETFYKMKEDEAVERLEMLREQLHIMRDRRIHELVASKNIADSEEPLPGTMDGLRNGSVATRKGSFPVFNWRKPVESAMGIGKPRFGRNSKALGLMGLSTANEQPQSHRQLQDGHRDFARRSYHDDVPYRVAKRKLKLALQEYYRGLELLKAYVLLNRTAFRKINKKYDKAVQARPPLKYMSEKVDKSWFVQSERLEGLLVAVEDLYARYFERGNHKVAVGKLRSKPGGNSYSGSVFRNGVMLTGGALLAIEALVEAGQYLDDGDSQISMQTSYLLQLYAGYFLGLLLFLLFTLICRIWTRAKINYVFIFEFDSRHNLDWRQLAEVPCLLSFMFGLALWLNFQPFSNPALFLWWPTILIGASLIILFLPAKFLYYRSRAWFLYSQFRLLLAGLYPVEFRDFFLGDMFCSLTYTMQNIEVYFCLLTSKWSDPEMCNSSHSRLLGFFSCMPAIWRFLQCIRRFHDTRNAWPHLVNCGKYGFTILFYMCLSLYRIDENNTYKAIFIMVGIINSLYTTTWDLLMDWSLGNPYAEHLFLRDDLGYKPVWAYYLAMFIDPFLRFSWVLYIVLPYELQHSAVLSFLIGLFEVLRRAMWTIFRVENEHCTNVGRFRASRDIPLPYEIAEEEELEEEEEESSSLREEDERTSETAASSRPNTNSHLTAHVPPRPVSYVSPHPAPRPSPRDLESGTAGVTSGYSARPRPSRRATFATGTPDTPAMSTSGGKLSRVGTAIATAHAQDFERRRKPGGAKDGSGGGGGGGGNGVGGGGGGGGGASGSIDPRHGGGGGGGDASSDEEYEDDVEQAELENAAERQMELDRERRDRSKRNSAYSPVMVGGRSRRDES